ncbi:MAG: hypothetical protein EOO62_00340 [Hymenobacter sp.]|nr:MAG: hypothetical protein EOO62_00340 [Hymenobacter sp.]
MKSLLLLATLLLTYPSYGQNRVWLIGTAHEERKYVNADSLLRVLTSVKPDVILMELETKHFTKDFKFDTTTYPLKDYLVTSENRASYTYQQQRGIQLRPFDIEGRHEFYAKEQYREREKKLFTAMMTLYKSNKLSDACKTDFELLLLALSSYSTLSFNSLKESNSDVATKFIALKSSVDLELMLSIVKQTKELKEWRAFAELRKTYWQKRNTVMCENIIRYSKEFADRRIVVLVGNDHKYILKAMLKEHKVDVKEY